MSPPIRRSRRGKPQSEGGIKDVDRPNKRKGEVQDNGRVKKTIVKYEDEIMDGKLDSTGPSAYELVRLEKIRKNQEVMESLGLHMAKGEMQSAVEVDKAQRAKARGLKPIRRKATDAQELPRRASSRIRGKDPDGKPMEDPELAFNRRNPKFKDSGMFGMEQELGIGVRAAPRRLEGNVTMEASNSSAEDTSRLRQMLGSLVRGDRSAKDEMDAYELAEPDETLKRLQSLKVGEKDVCKVVRERAYGIAWHPSSEKLLLAVGDKVGNLGLWSVDSDDGDGDDGVFQFKPHTSSIPHLEFDPIDAHKLISTSYDGTVRRMDVEVGAFEQVFANKEEDDVILTYGHLMGMERTLLLSDGAGEVNAVDLRINKEVWRCAVHEKKVNTVHGHPSNSHIFATASLDRTVKVWDVRSLGRGKGKRSESSAKPKVLAEMPHHRSVNSAHFSPGGGEWMVTVGQDDKLRLYRDVAQQANGVKISPEHVMPHNNQTGRWLTKFQAAWDPKSTGLFSIGSMQREPHAVHVYSVRSASKGGDKESGKGHPSAVKLDGGDVMTSIQSLVVFHPGRDIIAGVNSSGRVHVFR